MDTDITKEQLFLMRRKKKITLKMVAKAMSCSEALVSMWERDLCNIDRSKKVKYKNFIIEF